MYVCFDPVTINVSFDLVIVEKELPIYFILKPGGGFGSCDCHN